MFRLSGLLAFLAAAAFGQIPCEQFKLSFPDATVTSIESIPAGPFQAPSPQIAPIPAPESDVESAGPAGPARAAAPRAAAPPPVNVPAYCRVMMILTPSSDSKIEAAVFLPTENWNGKLQVVGNGGWAGTVSYPAMADALREGYATASNDTGHRAADMGGNGMFALGHPEKITDFAYRAMHETVVKAKAITAAFYGSGPKYSYYNGCSTGGRQGLVEATRFPDDFDAVVAGAPANPHVHLHAAGVERSLELMKNNAPLSKEKVETLHKAVMDACDGLDGVKDGIISNPERCHYDPSALLCKNGNGASCLTPAELKTVQTVFSDVRTKTGEVIWTGYPAGTELDVAALRNTPKSPGGVWDVIRILGHQNKDYDWHNFDLAKEVAQADKAGIDVLTFDLSAFKAHGGKLLLYHGWADPGIPPGHTVSYYKSVLDTMGGKQDDWLRLFMEPGMAHCRGGAGPDQFNKMAVIERWREKGEAPNSILAARVANGRIEMTRPLCPYPQAAVYKGTGSTNDAENFSCKQP
ncbi:MAG TPA: tannase/feruloyl esterase family alpha/beta hydrolase [Bryobacteraceae bacterium]|nr:tannase/feruloyl esterase family alpha/beta hydrolase [Bryobacteraceae bacterium]